MTGRVATRGPWYLFFFLFFSSLLNIYLEIGLLTMDSHHTLSAATPEMPAPAAGLATVTAIATVVQRRRHEEQRRRQISSRGLETRRVSSCWYVYVFY
jgi:hypothetical protein